MKKIAEGKTKIIWQNPKNSNQVVIESKSAITAGDGEKKDELEGKDIYSNITTCNVLEFLNSKGINTHYILRNDDNSFIARKCKMIPVEIVIRRVAFGSYLKRNPNIQEGGIFKEPIIELFLKDDDNHDPLMIWNDGIGLFELHDAKKPFLQGKLNRTTNVISLIMAACLLNIATKTFLLLEEVWQKQGVTLVDLKIECGVAVDRAERFGINVDGIVVADVIDNDSWRIWPGGDKGQMKDKQIYRDSSEMTAKVRDSLKKNYAWVAEITSQF